jgi:hypothetical protein
MAGPAGAGLRPGVRVFLAGWLPGSQEHGLAGSLAAFVGRTAYNTGAFRTDLQGFAFLLGASDGRELFGEPTPRSTKPC